jgi:hypothetical protein
VGDTVEPVRWLAEADRLWGRLAGRFTRVQTRRRARGFLFGLLGELPRKNCWSIAEHAGDCPVPGLMETVKPGGVCGDGGAEEVSR